MKKQLLMLLLFLSVFTGLQAVTKDEVNRTIISVHTKVFGKNDLFKEQINQEDAIKWHEMLQEVQKYIIENAQGNKLLLNLLEKAVLDGYIIVNNSRRIYSMVFQEKVKNSIAWAKKQLSQLAERKNAIIRSDRNLKAQIFAGKQKNAKEVLTNLLLVLELTINKLIKDFNKDLVRVAIK